MHSLISSSLRTNNWLKSFIPSILGYLYFWIYYYSVPLKWNVVLLILLFLISSIGFASFGYLVNDFFDREDDEKCGKTNFLISLPSIKIAPLFFFTIILSVVPWLFLPFNFLTLVLLATQAILYFLYNAPPFRLKKIPFLSNLLDLIYAYIIPFFLTLITLLIFSKQSLEIDTIIVFFFVLLIITGFLNILIHQKEDVLFDMKTNFKTLPILLGKQKTLQFEKFLTLTQYAIFLCFVIILVFKNYLFLILYPVFFVHLLINRNNFEYKSSFHPLVINKFLQIYLPLLLLVLLSFKSIYWLILIPVHLILFTTKKTFDDLFFTNKTFYSLKYIVYETFFCKYLRPLLSKLTNQLIYRLFLIFNVNLKKENKDAWAYLKEKFRK